MKTQKTLTMTLIVLFGVVLVVSALLFTFSRDQTAYASGNVVQQIGHISGATWQVQGVAAGGDYRLLSMPLSPSGTGTQCCCTYLPCLLKKP